MEKKWNFKKHKRQVAELPTLKIEDVEAFIFAAAEHPDPTLRNMAVMTLTKNHAIACQWVRDLRMKKIKWN